MATLKRTVTKKTLQNQKSVKQNKKKVTRPNVTKKKIFPTEVKKQDIVLHNLKEEQILIKPKNNKIKKVIYSFLFALFIILGAIFIGYTLYEPIETGASGSDFLNCKYGEWVETEVPFCLVSPEGKYFENDRIIYVYQEETGTCIKKTREKICSYQ